MINKNLIPYNPIIEYPDYRNFINFIYNQHKIFIKNINPYEYFRLNSTNLQIKIDTKKLGIIFFKGKYIPIPHFKVGRGNFNNYSRFEDFTINNEVNNLSLWSLSCLKNLSYESEVRLGKELEILQEDNPRDGRLDVVVLSNNHLLTLEVKVSLPSLLREGRFKFQIPAYYKEITAIAEKYKKETGQKLSTSIFLIIGGEETDIYPSSHPDCTTGQVGKIAEIFYDFIIEYDLKFISANALWALSSTSELRYKKIYWYDLLPKLFSDKESIGLLSGGIVRTKAGKIEVSSLSL